jgi:glycosyltransferase involved in cell wall biosynthesis
VSSVAIFIPSYNAAKTLPDVVERIPNNLWADIEAVFVINDGTTAAPTTPTTS